MNELAEPSAKRSRIVKAVIREKGPAKPKTKKVKKAKAARRRKNSPEPEAGERRRSSRVSRAADYKERDDAADEEEMLDGVAEWQYGDSSDEMEASGSEEESGDEVEASEEEEEEEAPKPVAKNDRKAGTKAKAAAGGKPAIKANVLAQLQRGGRTSRSSKGYDMDLDD